MFRNEKWNSLGILLNCKNQLTAQTRASWERALRVMGREDGCLAAPDLPIRACLAPTHTAEHIFPVNNVHFCCVLSDIERDQVSSCVCACVWDDLYQHTATASAPPLRPGCDRNAGGAFAPTPAVDLTLTDFDVRGQKSSRTRTNSPRPPAAAPRGARSQTARLHFSMSQFFSIIYYTNSLKITKKLSHTHTDKITYKVKAIWLQDTHCLRVQKHKNFWKNS